MQEQNEAKKEKKNNLTTQSKKSISKLKQQNKLKKEKSKWKHHTIEM